MTWVAPQRYFPQRAVSRRLGGDSFGPGSHYDVWSLRSEGDTALPADPARVLSAAIANDGAFTSKREVELTRLLGH